MKTKKALTSPPSIDTPILSEKELRANCIAPA